MGLASQASQQGSRAKNEAIRGPARASRIAALARAWLSVAGGAPLVLAASVVSRRGRESLLRAARGFGYAWDVGPGRMVPRVAEADVAPEETPVVIREAAQRDGNVALQELLLLNRLVAVRRPARIFEIGTFDFRTAINFAANAPPGAHVFTLDLPGSDAETALPVAKHDARYLGRGPRVARSTAPAEHERITALRGDSATFDFSPYMREMDLVFVDGAHSYEYVRRDSETALALAAPGAVLLWHDYGAWPGVTGALNELFLTDSRFAGLRWIAGTSLAIMDLRPAAV